MEHWLCNQLLNKKNLKKLNMNLEKSYNNYEN